MEAADPWRKLRRFLIAVAVLAVLCALGVFYVRHTVTEKTFTPCLSLVNDTDKPVHLVIHLGSPANKTDDALIPAGGRHMSKAHYQRIPANAFIERLDERNHVAATAVLKTPDHSVSIANITWRDAREDAPKPAETK